MMLDGYEPDNWKHLPNVGAYGGFTGMWRYPGEARNEFFRCAARWSSAEWPAWAIFGWQLPDGAPPAGVSGYLKVTHGNSQGDIPAVPLTSRRLSAVTALKYTRRSQVASSTPVSTLSEFWPTNVPCASGALTGVQAEIGEYPDVSDETRDWAASLTKVGAYAEPSTGITWDVANTLSSIPFITFRPRSVNNVQGQVDWLDRINWLSAQGVYNKSWYWNGIGFGPEPVQGDGSALVGLRCDAYA